MDTFGQRLVTSREKHNLSQKEFAERLGITPTRLNYWEKDKREPAIEMIKLIAQNLDIDPNYLIGYQPQNEKAPSSEKDRLCEAELRLVELYRSLNHEGQEKVFDYADDLVSSGKYIKSDPAGLGKAQEA